MEGLDDTLSALRFAADDRLQEAKALLDSSLPVLLHVRTGMSLRLEYCVV